MLKSVKLKAGDAAGIGLLLLLLVSVRLFQDILFYDPFISFFKSDSKTLPKIDNLKLFGGLLFRYTLNTLFSTGIIWLLFKDKAITVLSAWLYFGFFIILIAGLFVVLNIERPNLLLLFYVRRFLIQPLFLILFIPAFYYQKKAQKNL